MGTKKYLDITGGNYTYSSPGQGLGAYAVELDAPGLCPRKQRLYPPRGLVVAGGRGHCGEMGMSTVVGRKQGKLQENPSYYPVEDPRGKKKLPHRAGNGNVDGLRRRLTEYEATPAACLLACSVRGK